MEQYLPEQKDRDALFMRLQDISEQMKGHFLELGRTTRWNTEVDTGPMAAVEPLLAAYDPGAHTTEDMFTTKVAFAALLNFPLTTLADRIKNQDTWSRRQWAEAKLAWRFSRRVPGDVIQEISRASADASQYVATYNIWMHHIVDDQRTRLWPRKLRLLEHWNLRDEIKASYSDAEHGLAKQRAIQKIFERIVDSTIPQVVIDNPAVDWNPFTNAVMPAGATDEETKPVVRDTKPSNAPEPNTRYAKILADFHAEQKLDAYSPTEPTLIARRFNEDRQIPEARVEKMLIEILSSPLVPRVAARIEARLGRKLEPFDIWYNGFRPRGAYSEAQLDEIVRKRYPTADAYKRDMPNLFAQLGFSPERAKYLADNIVVDPARGSGHALGAARRADHPHLRTRIGTEGMDYKGFNIAVHEMGHSVEQTFSLNDIDHTTLSGVPNNAFTEALAFVFQNKDLELLGLAKPTEEAAALKTLNDFWGTYEISGVALVDMRMWHWMYDHPSATPAELKNATVQIARDIWNRYYAPVFHQRDVTLLGVYAHMVNNFLYLPDYPIGHMIAFQIEEQIAKAGKIGPEFERMAKFGSLAPDLWMKNATGAPVGPAALLHATQRALAAAK
jgi:hypothetical protein